MKAHSPSLRMQFKVTFEIKPELHVFKFQKCIQVNGDDFLNSFIDSINSCAKLVVSSDAVDLFYVYLCHTHLCLMYTREQCRERRSLLVRILISTCETIIASMYPNKHMCLKTIRYYVMRR